MNRPYHRISVGMAGIVLLLLALACTYGADAPNNNGNDGGPSSGPAATAAPAVTAPNAGGPAAGTVELTAAPAGRACFGTAGSGAACLDEAGAWQTYNRDNSGLRANYIDAMAVCDDGTILMAHSNGVDALNGASWTAYEDGWDGGSPDAIACAAGGRAFWVAHFRGVSYFDGAAWTTYPAATLATGPDASDLVHDVVIGADGIVWVATSSSVASFTNDTWSVYQEGAGFADRPFPSAIDVDSAGRVWITDSGGVAVQVEGQWQTFDAPDYYSFETMAIGYGDQLWIGTLSDGAMAFNGSSWASILPGPAGLGSGGVNDVAVDDQGRVWIATDYGLSVFDGGAWLTYQMHTADLPDNDIAAIAIVAGGPALPALQEKAPGSLVGQLFQEDGTPIAGARVEVCVEYLGSTYFGDTPCSDQPFFLSTTTDADGRFTFAELPAGLYSLTADPGGDQWAQLTGDFGFSEQVPITAGEQTDVGELYLSNEE